MDLALPTLPCVVFGDLWRMKGGVAGPLLLLLRFLRGGGGGGGGLCIVLW